MTARDPISICALLVVLFVAATVSADPQVQRRKDMPKAFRDRLQALSVSAAPVVRKRDEAIKSLREILLALSTSQDFETAAQELVDLEARWLEKEDLLTLEDEQLRLIHILARRRPEAAYPIAILYGELRKRYRATLQPELAEHAGMVFFHATEGYRRRVFHLEEPKVRSRNLTRLGFLLFSFGELNWARQNYLLPATKLDPSSSWALHLLAALDEKLNRYTRAAGFLDRLLVLNPEDLHARLRRGMVGIRLGKESQALADFEVLMAEAAPLALQVLAFEETIRLQLRGGARARALAYLEEARLRFPQEQGFLILRLLLLPGETTEVLAQLEALKDELAEETIAPEFSPRMLYNNWPQNALEELRESVTVEMEPYLETLGRLLKEDPSAR